MWSPSLRPDHTSHPPSSLSLGPAPSKTPNQGLSHFLTGRHPCPFPSVSTTLESMVYHFDYSLAATPTPIPSSLHRPCLLEPPCGRSLLSTFSPEKQEAAEPVPQPGCLGAAPQMGTGLAWRRFYSPGVNTDRTEPVRRVKGRKDVQEGLGNFGLEQWGMPWGHFSKMGRMGRSRFGRETKASCSGFCLFYPTHRPSIVAGLPPLSPPA